MTQAPKSLSAIAIVFVATEIFWFVANATVSGALRIGIYSFLLYFVVQGSRGAAYLWAVLTLFGAVNAGVSGLDALPSSQGNAALLLGHALFFVGAAGYVVLSPRVRKYQSARNWSLQDAG